MTAEDMRLRERQAEALRIQLEEWQSELDLLESRPGTRMEFKERIELLREKLRAGTDELSGTDRPVMGGH